MTMFKIEIKETYSRTVYIKAENLDEAMSIVSDLYDDGTIKLDETDSIDVEMRWRC